LSRNGGVGGGGSDDENNIHRILHQPDVDYELPSNSSYGILYTHTHIYSPSCFRLPLSLHQSTMCQQKLERKKNKKKIRIAWV
jgi:hypothetical protein